LTAVVVLGACPATSKAVPLFAAPHFSLALNDGDSLSSPEFADIDGDGDLDAFVGETNGSLFFFENIGTTDSPVFASPVENPFSIADLGPGATTSPAFADIDDDGDLDLFVGQYSGSIAYFENIGSPENPSFATPSVNPFSLTDVGTAASPTFADIDDDGDLDAFVGEISGSTYFFENVGTPTTPSFGPVTTDPFGLVNVALVLPLTPVVFSSPAFADVDGDGDLDAFIGAYTGHCVFMRNLGSPSVPAFGTASILPQIGDVGFNATPALVDIDADGDFDIFVGELSRSVHFFENTGSDSAFNFARPAANPFGLGDVISFASPVFVDIDGDGDLDAFIGQQPGTVVFFENTGSAAAPAFPASTTNPFGLTDVGQYSAPAFADIDGDGDLDALIGEGTGNFFYFENVGSSTAPSFAAAVVEPFGLAGAGPESRPCFADIDGDGDLDLFAGHAAGNIFFFQNTGSATSPAFAPAVINPFGLGDIGTDSTPAFADIDGDGDLDAFTGEGRGAIVYFENIGTATAPAFATGSINPFGLEDVGSWSSPTFADIDGDGDLDLLAGERLGATFFFENVSAFGCPTTPANCIEGSTKALLSVKEKSAGEEKLLAKLALAGPSISQSDFGNPLISAGTAYGLCIYGDDDLLAGQLVVDRAGGACGALPCWRAVGGAPPNGKGFAYKDSTSASNGVSIIKAKSSPAGSARLLVKATNKTGHQPIGIAGELAGDISATIQIHTSDAACFSGSVSDIKKNDATAFKGR